MRRFAIALCAVAALTWGAATASADSIELRDFGFNINGVVLIDSSPAFANTAAFDMTTGLGTITLDYRPGAGTFDLAAFFDHDITGLTNEFDNEFAATSGTPDVGQSWEMDELGYTVGDLYFNFIADPSALDNQILDGTYNGPQDIAMALGWNFTIPDANTRALITINASTAAPAGGFYLHQYDPGGDIYLSGALEIADIPTNGAEVPEPASLLLIGTGMSMLFGARRLRRR